MSFYHRFLYHVYSIWINSSWWVLGPERHLHWHFDTNESPLGPLRPWTGSTADRHDVTSLVFWLLFILFILIRHTTITLTFSGRKQTTRTFTSSGKRNMDNEYRAPLTMLCLPAAVLHLNSVFHKAYFPSSPYMAYDYFLLWLHPQNLNRKSAHLDHSLWTKTPGWPHGGGLILHENASLPHLMVR